MADCTSCGGGTQAPPVGGGMQPTYSHVGEKRGSYEKVDTYNFVGGSHGAWEKEIVREHSDYKLRPSWWMCLTIAAVAVVLAIVIWKLGDILAFGQDTFGLATPEDRKSHHGSREAHQDVRPEPRPSFESSTKPTLPLDASFDCTASFANWENAWSEAKKDWCCKNRAVGCVSQVMDVCLTTCQFKGEAHTCGDRILWLATRKYAGMAEACGLARAEVIEHCPTCRGCTVSACGCHRAAGTTAALLPLYYDCEAGFDIWQQKWSAAKQEWCCQRSQRGCSKSALSV